MSRLREVRRRAWRIETVRGRATGSAPTRRAVTLQRRVVAGVTALSFLTLGGAFVSISVAADRAREVQLDEALQREALDEVQELTTNASRLAVRNRVLPSRPARTRSTPRCTGPAASSRTDHRDVVGARRPRATAPDGAGRPLQPPRRHWRGFARGAGVGAEPRRRHLLVGAPRTDLDGDPALPPPRWRWCSWWRARGRRRWRAGSRGASRATSASPRWPPAAGGDLSRASPAPSTDAEAAQLGRDPTRRSPASRRVVDGQRRFIANAAHGSARRSPRRCSARCGLHPAASAARRLPRGADRGARVGREQLPHAHRRPALALARLGVIRRGPRRRWRSIWWPTARRQDDRRRRRRRGVRFRNCGRRRASAWDHASDLAASPATSSNAVRHAPPGSGARCRSRRRATTRCSRWRQATVFRGRARADLIFEPSPRVGGARVRRHAGAASGLGSRARSQAPAPRQSSPAKRRAEGLRAAGSCCALLAPQRRGGSGRQGKPGLALFALRLASRVLTTGRGAPSGVGELSPNAHAICRPGAHRNA